MSALFPFPTLFSTVSKQIRSVHSYLNLYFQILSRPIQSFAFDKEFCYYSQCKPSDLFSSKTVCCSNYFGYIILTLYQTNFFTSLQYKFFLKHCGKGEIARNEQLLVTSNFSFPHSVHHPMENFLPFSSNLKFSFTNSSSKICRLGKGLLGHYFFEFSDKTFL